jgi:hypothetical protein
MKIYYVTGNELKVKVAKSIFEKRGVDSEMSEEEQIAFFNQDVYLNILEYLSNKKKTR